MFGKLGLGLGLGVGLGAQSQRRNKDMILVYEIPASGTDIELAIQANSGWFSAGQKVVINWGDGSAAETVSATSDHTGYVGHTYTAAGTYTVKISGSMTMYGRYEEDEIAGQELLTHIHSFGELGITSLAYAFNGCSGIVSVPKTLPSTMTNISGIFSFCYGDAFNPDVSNWNVSNVTNMAYMFGDCSGDAFNPDVSKWNVSEVTNMYAMFCYCSGAAFNPDVTNWNVSEVTNMGSMFEGCSGASFNPNVSNWNVSKVTSMAWMFSGCYGAAFNPDVTNWDVSKVTDMLYMFGFCNRNAFNPNVSKWNVSKVTNMAYMFGDCSGDAFNPDVSNWDVSKVENMSYMFGNCNGASFNPDVSNWNVSKVTNMSYMFSYCNGAAFRGGRGVSGNGIANWQLKAGNNAVNMGEFMASSKTQEPAFLDEILNAWADLHAQGKLPTNITVDFGNNKYTAAGAAAYATLTDTVANGGAGWTITSGGLQA